MGRHSGGKISDPDEEIAHALDSLSGLFVCILNTLHNYMIDLLNPDPELDVVLYRYGLCYES
jgi:hypothetical protein